MTQCDLKNKKDTGFDFFLRLEEVPNVKVITLISNHRHPIVEPILSVYEKYKD
jgi:hypothetical protein